MAKQKKIKKFSLQSFDNAHYQTTEQYTMAVDALFNRATDEIARIAAKGTYNPDKPFSFNDYPQTKKQFQSIINGLASSMTSVIEAGSRKQWLFACKKNDGFINSIMDTSKVSKSLLNKMQDQNLDALKAFQARKVKGMNLSQRVWKYIGQYKDQVEQGLDVGLGDGRSAQQLSKDLRQNLQDPNRLFRRVRDKRGNLQLSKNAKAFHPGQGVYRSSYKNAMRLTRSEVNMAYRESDWMRWQQLDFVIGFEIRRSNREPQCKCKLCDKLAGRYPKQFKFKGWHPQCMCYATPIMEDYFSKSRSKDRVSRLKDALNGTEHKKYVSAETIADMPQGFKDWVAENEAQQGNWASVPYFIQDNFKDGVLANGLNFTQPEQVKPIKTEQQKAEIQQQWNTRVASRKYNDQLQEIKGTYTEESNAIVDFANVIESEIQKGTSMSEIDALVNELNHKIQVKAAWDERVEINSLETLLVDVKGLKSQFDMPTIQSVFNAVEAKLATWENLPLEQQVKKLTFEIEWVEKNKKYDTWHAAQAAYKKRLLTVQYLIDKESIQTSVSHALAFAKTSKSAKIKQLAMDLDVLLNSNAPIGQLKQKALVLNSEVAKLEAAKAARDAKKQNAQFGLDGLDESNYTQARKDAAMWAKDSEEADKKVRGILEGIWQNATNEEKEAAYYYTSGSSYVNEPLRGLVYSGNKGRNSQKDIDNLTNVIDKSSYNFDMWIQRGVGTISVEKMFGINLNAANATDAKQFLIGKVGVEPAFASCGNSKGSGFSSSEVIYNIYCPKGTKMLYCEPFSAYAGGNKGVSKNGLNWDGKAKAKKIGYEAEMLLQRSTKFRVTKAEKAGYRWYIDLEVIGQL